MREASVLKPVTHPVSTIEKRYPVKTATSSNPRNIKGAAGATAQQIGAAASDEVRNLIADIEALVDRVGEAADPGALAVAGENERERLRRCCVGITKLHNLEEGLQFDGCKSF